ncbi:hypothetical protein XENOCAPTIV_000595 [Xenoophorus captivus]|uniref:Uncharacterized protein n=1 Tax=Xenoophorus captivus TaxID=1517983 RepID=A0ABV0QVJ9_9TELE
MSPYSLDFTRQEIPPPEFVLTKPDIQWSEEEKNMYKEYERNMKDLSDKKEKYKRTLEIEMKKLQESIKDATEKFDKTLMTLYERKLKCTVAIYQEELKITYLADSVLTVEEMNNQERELRLKLERMLAHKAPDGFSQMLKAMEELDAPENMPEEINLSIWERFCFVRKTKVESEQTKVASMEARSMVHKYIIQLEWEHRVLNKKIEDSNDKKRDIKMFRLTEEQQDMRVI